LFNLVIQVLAPLMVTFGFGEIWLSKLRSLVRGLILQYLNAKALVCGLMSRQ
jgi:hypothetical protein